MIGLSLIFISVFESHGVSLDQAISALCYNGNSASLLSLAAAVCGNESTGVYFVCSKNNEICNISHLNYELSP